MNHWNAYHDHTVGFLPLHLMLDCEGRIEPLRVAVMVTQFGRQERRRLRGTAGPTLEQAVDRAYWQALKWGGGWAVYQDSGGAYHLLGLNVREAKAMRLCGHWVSETGIVPVIWHDPA